MPKGNKKIVINLQESSVVGEVGKSFHWINAGIEDRQGHHQYVIVEIEGTISK